jgi:hypothetical protein
VHSPRKAEEAEKARKEGLEWLARKLNDAVEGLTFLTTLNLFGKNIDDTGASALANTLHPFGAHGLQRGKFTVCTRKLTSKDYVWH